MVQGSEVPGTTVAMSVVQPKVVVLTTVEISVVTSTGTSTSASASASTTKKSGAGRRECAKLSLVFALIVNGVGIWFNGEA